MMTSDEALSALDKGLERLLPTDEAHAISIVYSLSGNHEDIVDFRAAAAKLSDEEKPSSLHQIGDNLLVVTGPAPVHRVAVRLPHVAHVQKYYSRDPIAA